MNNLKSLLGKLNDTSRRALEAAAGLCLSRTNYEVDIEHLLVKLLEAPNTDLPRIAAYFELNFSRLSRELTMAIDRFKTGNARTPALSPRVPHLISAAWLIGVGRFWRAEHSIRISAARAPDRHGAVGPRPAGVQRAAAHQAGRAPGEVRVDRGRVGGGPRSPPRNRRPARRRSRWRAGGHQGARSVHHRSDRRARRKARSTRSLAAISRSARSSTS